MSLSAETIVVDSDLEKQQSERSPIFSPPFFIAAACLDEADRLIASPAPFPVSPLPLEQPGGRWAHIG